MSRMTDETVADQIVATHIAWLHDALLRIELADADIVERPQVVAAMDVVEILDALHTVQEIRRVLAKTESTLTRAATAAMPDRVALEGSWFAERTWSKKRTAWDNDALIDTITDLARVDRDTGEVVDDPGPPFWRLRDYLTACARPSWRVTALRDLSITPGDYCHEDEAVPSVRFYESQPPTEEGPS